MSERFDGERPAMQDLSSLMDGELDASAVTGVCRLWREDAQARTQWHAYHLIGDVLRSEDLACEGARDSAFLRNLRKRLADEPVVLAPTPMPATSVAEIPVTRVRRSWAAPAAIAAGFVVVAGALVVTQMAGGLSQRVADQDATLAQVPSGLRAVALTEGSASGVGDPPNVVLNGQLVRDARLDEYLAAHKKFGGSSLPGGPSGSLRNAAADGTAR